jgi:hypothetical protein
MSASLRKSTCRLNAGSGKLGATLPIGCTMWLAAVTSTMSKSRFGLYCSLSRCRACPNGRPFYCKGRRTGRRLSRTSRDGARPICLGIQGPASFPTKSDECLPAVLRRLGQSRTLARLSQLASRKPIRHDPHRRHNQNTDCNVVVNCHGIVPDSRPEKSI